jgi:hypothetical protein
MWRDASMSGRRAPLSKKQAAPTRDLPDFLPNYLKFFRL